MKKLERIADTVGVAVVFAITCTGAAVMALFIMALVAHIGKGIYMTF